MTHISTARPSNYKRGEGQMIKRMGVFMDWLNAEKDSA
ncbi:hypothetical protein SAMN04490247_1127 [Salimicrobium halophilum]|uniref:Uncharacterized protein n=1 Tax=Salimicrobium halophilum TaxID=86666 RepID=A0A1G8RMG2_9BACI|nr:hypothetical protein SAMN04490247_1127 [Salimicrobium halophilum]